MTLPNKINLSLIISTVVYIVLIIFVILPLFSGIKESSQELVSQKQILASFEAYLESLDKFKNLYFEIEPNVNKSSNLFIDPEVPVDFITFLETTASNSQLPTEISGAVPVEAGEDPWGGLVFQIISTGSFSKFLKFLEKLETSPYLIKIQGLSIRKISESNLRGEEAERFSLEDVRVSFAIKVLAQ